MVMGITRRHQPDTAEVGNLVKLPLPVTTSETITAVAHFHRAEIARMTSWRNRIDLTTNWAITVVAGMLSVSLSTPTAHHGVLLFAMVLVWLLLWIEARRYRFFDVYRARVRQLERNYYAEIFAPQPQNEPAWTCTLGEDLRRPRFLISLGVALSRRLRRNYYWMFLVLLIAWVLKISNWELKQGETGPQGANLFLHAVGNAALGPFPGWAVVLAVAAFFAGLSYTTFRPRTESGELAHGEVHV
jgi:uncharacterized membrane protein